MNVARCPNCNQQSISLIGLFAAACQSFHACPECGASVTSSWIARFLLGTCACLLSVIVVMSVAYPGLIIYAVPIAVLGAIFLFVLPLELNEGDALGQYRKIRRALRVRNGNKDT